MLRVVMAILAEVDNLLNHQIFVSAAVRRVADDAIFRDWRMFPYPRTTFFRMAFVAKEIDGIGLDHVFCLGAVGVVAIRALDFALNDGMMRHLVGIGTDIFMAVEAHCGLFYGGTRGMDIVAGDTGYIIFLVRAHIPQGKMSSFLVAAQAFLAEFIGSVSSTFVEGDYVLL